MTMYRLFLTSRGLVYTDSLPRVAPARRVMVWYRALKYGLAPSARSFAWRILEDATSSIALVICMVDCTDLIRRLMSFIFPEAIFSPSLSR